MEESDKDYVVNLMRLMQEEPGNVSYTSKYDAIFRIDDGETARRYLRACVDHCMRLNDMAGKPIDKQKAMQIEKTNIGYYAGYGTAQDRLRVENLFGCIHPFLGPAEEQPSPGIMLALGKAVGRSGSTEPLFEQPPEIKSS